MKITRKIFDFLTPLLCCPDTYCDGAVQIQVEDKQDRAEAEYRAYLEVLEYMACLERSTERLQDFIEARGPVFALENETRLIRRRTEQVLEAYKAFTAIRKRQQREEIDL